jgi:hypothetical protein
LFGKSKEWAVLAVVPFKRKRRRLSLRHYICTETGPFRVTSRLARELAHREVAVPQFANSVQRMVEVFVEKVAGEIRDIQIRPTHAHFDDEGKVDFRPAVEAWALFINGSSPKHLNEKVVDISSTLKARQLDRGTKWRISASVRRAITADITGNAQLPILRISK